ncbi:MAG: hypothetical protein KA020_15815 [Planctomycetes bacterium]|jgi:hypothetical protein|nr:hypothetical protein [Planctomycetota bacterium]
MRSSSLVTWILVLCGALCGLLVSQLVPKEFRNGIPDLHQQDYRLVRTETTAYEISDAKWISVPWLYADFDLSMDVELSEKMDLDVLVRQVEPRRIGNKTIPFDGRFSVLRLSTERAGEVWRTREQALFERRTGGAELAAGYTATVWVQARGRMLRANVAGTWYPWFEADDVYGSLTLVAHGGKAVLKSLLITNLGQPRAWLWSQWLWIGMGVAMGLFQALVVGFLRLSALRSCGVMVFVNLLAVVVLTQVPFLVPEWPKLELPPTIAFWVCFLPGLILAVGLLAVEKTREGGLWYFVVLTVWVYAPLEVISIARTYRVPDSSERHVISTFGPASGSAPSEALAQRVRGPYEVHDVSPVEYRVFLLGGQLLYNRAAPEQHLEPLLSGDLRTQLGQRVDVPCLPTEDGYSAQQWRMFETFYTAYNPNVIVFGVPREESAHDRHGTPRSSPVELARTLETAREYCGKNRIQLVLFTEAQLPPDLMAVMKKAESKDLPLLVAGADESPMDLSKRLADTIAPLLKAQKAKKAK